MNQKTQLKTCEEGFRNFDSKSLTEEEHFIKTLVDPKYNAGGELLNRGQRRKLQLYGDNGERVVRLWNYKEMMRACVLKQ